MFKDNKKAYGWFAGVMAFLGVSLFVISLVSAIASGKMDSHMRERTIYFDRKILPDHLFYPVLVTFDRLELELADKQTQTLLKMDYAGKRLSAAKALFVQGKKDLAFVTLGKAHQYLLRANNDMRTEGQEKQFKYLVNELNQEFVGEYDKTKQYMTDAQKAVVDGWRGEILIFLAEEAVTATAEGAVR